MYIRVRPGLTRGSIFLAVILGIGTGFYIWKPMFDPAEKHKLAKYEKPSTSGNECSISLCVNVIFSVRWTNGYLRTALFSVRRVNVSMVRVRITQRK